MSFIPYGRQDIDQEDIEAVVDCLNSDFLTQGPRVPEFESVVSKYCGSLRGVAVNSATSALHIACLALGVSEGDRVWTSAITFVATSNAALYCGASVDFVDINLKTYNMCLDQLERKLESAQRKDELPHVVIPVHMCGQSCDMKRMAKLADKYGFRVIEDASHAVGASFNGFKVGACEFSDICVFSFHPVKIITTGEGGMAMTNDLELARFMDLYRSHGVCKSPKDMQTKKPEAWFYEQQILGYNYRMTDLAAALGSSQVSRLDSFVNSRHTLAARYSKRMSHLPIKLPFVEPGVKSSFHLYVILLDIDRINSDRKAVFDALRSLEIGVNIHYIPVYLQPYYQKFGFSQGYCKNAEEYYSRCLTLPLYPGLSFENQDLVITTLEKVLLR